MSRMDLVMHKRLFWSFSHHLVRYSPVPSKHCSDRGVGIDFKAYNIDFQNRAVSVLGLLSKLPLTTKVGELCNLASACFVHNKIQRVLLWLLSRELSGYLVHR